MQVCGKVGGSYTTVLCKSKTGKFAFANNLKHLLCLEFAEFYKQLKIQVMKYVIWSVLY